jgi:hypothetical protein
MSGRTAARHLGISTYAVRFHLQAIDAMFESSTRAA